MRNFILIAATLTVIAACSGNKKEKATDAPLVKIDSLLITDSSWGIIKGNEDIAALQKMFGPENLKDDSICGPECADTIAVTLIYPNTDKQIFIHWNADAFHKSIAFLECLRPEAPYYTDKGLKIGSTLNDLVKANGKKVTFSGFAWDYGGMIQSFNNGTLEKSATNYRLDPGSDFTEELIGDIELDTDMPAVKKAADKITLYYISLSFEKRE